MVVKVIKITPDESVIKQVICRHCGVTLEYVPNDVKTFNGTDYSGISSRTDSIQCPNCWEKVILRLW